MLTIDTHKEFCVYNREFRFTATDGFRNEWYEALILNLDDPSLWELAEKEPSEFTKLILSVREQVRKAKEEVYSLSGVINYLEHFFGNETDGEEEFVTRYRSSLSFAEQAQRAINCELIDEEAREELSYLVDLAEDNDYKLPVKVTFVNPTLGMRNLGGGIYFVRRKDNGLIKIGTSGNIKARLCMLQSLTDAQLEYLAKCNGSLEEESMLHEKFKHLNVTGEWFQPGEDLLDHIKSLSEANKQKHNAGF